MQLRCVDAHALLVPLRGHAHVADERDHGRDVLQARHIFENDGLVGEQGGAQLRQRGVLGAGNPDLAVELAAPADQ